MAGYCEPAGVGFLGLSSPYHLTALCHRLLAYTRYSYDTCTLFGLNGSALQLDRRGCGT